MKDQNIELFQENHSFFLDILAGETLLEQVSGHFNTSKNILHVNKPILTHLSALLAAAPAAASR